MRKTDIEHIEGEPLPAAIDAAQGSGSGLVAVGPSFIPQEKGGALLKGGVPGHKGANQYTTRQRAEAVRELLLGQLEGVGDDSDEVLKAARGSD